MKINVGTTYSADYCVNFNDNLLNENRSVVYLDFMSLVYAHIRICKIVR